MDDFGMAAIAAIGAILEKGVFKGTTYKNRKSGVKISPTLSVDEPALVASTKSEVERLERAGGIEDNSISGSD